MPRKQKPKPDDPAESKRFIETAKELADDDADKRFERAVKAIISPKKSS